MMEKGKAFGAWEELNSVSDEDAAKIERLFLNVYEMFENEGFSPKDFHIDFIHHKIDASTSRAMGIKLTKK